MQSARLTVSHPVGPIETKDRDNCAIRDFECPLCWNETLCERHFANDTLTFAKHYTIFIKNNIYFPFFKVKVNNTFPTYAKEQKDMGYFGCVWGRKKGSTADGAGNVVAVLPDCPFFEVGSSVCSALAVTCCFRILIALYRWRRLLRKTGGYSRT